MKKLISKSVSLKRKWTMGCPKKDTSEIELPKKSADLVSYKLSIAFLSI